MLMGMRSPAALTMYTGRFTMGLPVRMVMLSAQALSQILA